jgi:putative hydrolase of the HAD superfamily
MIFYREWHKPKVLSFDLDDTLYDNTKIIQYAQNHVLKLLCLRYLGGQMLSSYVISKIKTELFDVMPSLQNDVSLIRYFVYKELLKKFGYSPKGQHLIAEKLTNYFLKIRSRVQVDNCTLEILKDLKKSYPLVAISNGNMNPEMTNLKGVFERVYTPDINTPAKPSSCLFNRVVNDYGIKSSDLCHIGDNYNSDILGGLNAGVLTVFQTCFQGKNNLKVIPHVEIENLTELRFLLLLI